MPDREMEHVEHRVAFDFEVNFSNGGGLKGWDFRLDIAGDAISDEELAAHIVRDLRLLMVGSVSVLNKRVFAEKHKRNMRASSAERATVNTAAGYDLFDLSHMVQHGKVTYPGLPAPVVTDYLSHEAAKARYAEGVTFQIGQINMVANTGTALDAPFHRFEQGQDVSALPLHRTANLEGILVRLSGMNGRAITKLALAPAVQEAAGKAVLIETGWSAKWGADEYFRNHPFLTAEAADYLRLLEVALIGIDSLNIDDTTDPTRPAHTILLGAGIPIVENLTGLNALPLSGFRFSAAPMRVVGMGAFPVRAWAVAAKTNQA